MAGKLFKLRAWLTIDEAARHLSIVLEETVTSADVLRLALDSHLVLSANFVNHAKAYLGRVLPFRDIPTKQVQSLLRVGQVGSKTMTLPDGFLIDETDLISDETRFVHLTRDPVTIDGVWDLAMRGGERLDVEHRFQHLTNGPPVELIDLDGTFVKRSDDEWAQILDQFDDEVEEIPSGKTVKQASYYPAGGLPRDAILVVRTQALADFQTKLSEESTGSHTGHELAARERDTLLKLVLGMAIEGYRHDPEAARSPASREIADDLAKHGMSVTDDTVRKYLKEGAKTVLPRRPGKS